MAQALTVTSFICNLFPTKCPQAGLPIVDLGYQRHQAIGYVESGDFFNFSNIRYAEPPVGSLRFKAPQKPKGKSKKLDRGDVGRICPQSGGSWEAIAAKFVPEFLTGTSDDFNFTQAVSVLPKRPKLGEDGRETEDCLFLDVQVPKDIWEKSAPKAPVLVWIHGGGYTGGEKTGDGEWNPTGLLKVASEPFITVSLNYRLGAFGFLGGPEFIKQGGQPNAGLYDQRMALDWVAENIHLFGGDKSRVTVMGESAGAGSLMHQITAFGGEGKKLPFQKAITQSPAFQPQANGAALDRTYARFLKRSGASDLSALGKASSMAVMKANDFVSYNSFYGSGGFGPTVDGKFVPKLPGVLLAEGKFHKDLDLMTSHVGNEGLIFTSPNATTKDGIVSILETQLPGLTTKQANFVSTTLYPSSAFRGDDFLRTVQAVTDVAFACNNYYLALAFDNATYSYEFNVFPPLHGFDLAYTWFNPAAPVANTGLLGPPDKTLAQTIQRYITSFMIAGKPVAKGRPALPEYGSGARLVQLTSKSNVTLVKDPAANSRCVYWQGAPYAPK